MTKDEKRVYAREYNRKRREYFKENNMTNPSVESHRKRRKEFRRTEEGRKQRQAEKKRLYGRSRKHAVNSRKLWDKEEERLVLNFKGTDFELSKIIGRSVQAIQAKRMRLTHKDD